MSDQHSEAAIEAVHKQPGNIREEVPVAVRAWLDSVGLTARWCENQEVEYAERYRKTRNAHDRMSAELLGKLSAAIRAVQP